MRGADEGDVPRGFDLFTTPSAFRLASVRARTGIFRRRRPFAIVTGIEFLVQETPGSSENADPSAKDPTPSAGAGLKA